MRPRTGPLRTLAVCLLLMAVSAAARADIITLVNGRTIRGRIVSDSGDRIVIEIPGGSITIRRSEVKSIERESEAAYRRSQARELFTRGKSKMALAELRRAVAAEPGSGPARKELVTGLLQRARELEALGSFAEAVRTYREALAFDEGNVVAERSVKHIRRRIEQLRGDIAEAKKLLRGGNHAAAQMLFEGVLDETPELRGELAGPYARTLVAFGNDLYKKRDYASAARLYGRSLEFDPALAAQIEPRYVNSRLHIVTGRISSGLFEEAEAELTELAEFSPANLEVKYVAGRYAEVRGRFREAAVVYADALGVSLVGSPGQAKAVELRIALQKKLDIAGERHAEEQREWARSDPGDWQVLTTARFQVHHHNVKVAETVASTAEFHIERIVAALALGEVTLEGRLRIYIHREAEEYVKATGQPEWSGGVSHSEFRGKAIADQYIASYQSSPRLLKSVIPHELTHILFTKAVGCGKEFPLALHEGVAVVMEPEYKQQHYRSVVWNHLRTETLIGVKELLAMTQYPESPELFYAQSSRLVEMLMQRAGAKKFLEFCRSVKEKGVERSLKDVYRIDGYEKLDELYQMHIDPRRIQPRPTRSRLRRSAGHGLAYRTPDALGRQSQLLDDLPALLDRRQLPYVVGVRAHREDGPLLGNDRQIVDVLRHERLVVLRVDEDGGGVDLDCGSRLLRGRPELAGARLGHGLHRGEPRPPALVELALPEPVGVHEHVHQRIAAGPQMMLVLDRDELLLAVVIEVRRVYAADAEPEAVLGLDLLTENEPLARPREVELRAEEDLDVRFQRADVVEYGSVIREPFGRIEMVSDRERSDAELLALSDDRRHLHRSVRAAQVLGVDVVVASGAFHVIVSSRRLRASDPVESPRQVLPRREREFEDLVAA